MTDNGPAVEHATDHERGKKDVVPCVVAPELIARFNG